MLNLLKRLTTELTEKKLKLNFCAGNPPADAEPAERYGLPPEFSCPEPSPQRQRRTGPRAPPSGQRLNSHLQSVE